MLYRFARVGFVLTVALTGFMAAIRAQPYEDAELQRLLQSAPDCPAPCFMGVQAGSTRIDTAIHILRGNDWIGQFHIQDDPRSGQPQSVAWKWSEKRPPLIRLDAEGGLRVSLGDGYNLPFVQSIVVPTSIPVGRIIELLGEPAAIDSGPGRHKEQAGVVAIYPKQALVVWAAVDCPITRWKYLNATAVIEFSSTIAYMEDFRGLNHWC
jgi:hypothetical protein